MLKNEGEIISWSMIVRLSSTMDIKSVASILNMSVDELERYIYKKEKSLFVTFFVYAFGFSQLSTKYETTKPPAMRVVSNKVIQNNHHSFYNEGVQAIKIRKNGDYNG